MYSRAIRIKKLGLLTIRPLSHGDTETVKALSGRLGMESRAQRLNGAEPRPSSAELAHLATVDHRRHTLVAYVDGDPEPAGIAQLVRDDHLRAHAEITFAVADCYQRKGIGSTLVDLLAADARAGGITHLTAMQTSNTAAYPLAGKASEIVEIHRDAGKASIAAAFEAA